MRLRRASCAPSPPVVASALLNDGRFAVLADRTTTGSPAQWGEAVVRCHDHFDADDVVVEVNFGGDMATEVVKQAAERVYHRGERDSNMIRVKEVSASRGKAMRAEPISLLYEKGRVLHRRGLDQLEAEMMASAGNGTARSMARPTGSMP